MVTLQRGGGRLTGRIREALVLVRKHRDQSGSEAGTVLVACRMSRSTSFARARVAPERSNVLVLGESDPVVPHRCDLIRLLN